MKLFLLIAIVFSTSLATANTGVKTIYSCTPDSGLATDIGNISVSVDKAHRHYYLAIERTRPVGREDIEEDEAFVYDDFTVTAVYEAPNLGARLLFYTEDDIGGQRNVLEIDGTEILVQCEYTGGSRR